MSNTKKIGLSLIIFFLITVVLLFFFNKNIRSFWFISTVICAAALIPFGFSLLVINAKSKLPKQIYLGIGITLTFVGLLSSYKHILGARIELIAGILWFCFAYSPLVLKDKYLKWLPYSKNKFESLLLSSIDYVAFSCIAIGIMFKFQKWPGANSLQSIGVLILLVGLFSWNFKFKKEVVRRKESEDKIQEQFSEIQDSIKYAKRIQSAILPSMRVIQESIKDVFVLYRPKDVVAGDFYWFEACEKETLIAVCDCTGHGVPGAMVSVVCNNALNRSVREFGLSEPGDLLDKTREIVISEFEKSDDEVKDGMDISLLSISKDTNTIKWSGANNPFWILRSGADQIEEIKANKQPIGKYSDHKPFTTHTIQLGEGDQVYLITDGFQDQFGGEKGKKFKAAALKELLVSIRAESLANQCSLLVASFENWKGSLEQVDDVCIIGIKL